MTATSPSCSSPRDRLSAPSTPTDRRPRHNRSACSRRISRPEVIRPSRHRKRAVTTTAVSGSRRTAASPMTIPATSTSTRSPATPAPRSGSTSTRRPGLSTRWWSFSTPPEPSSPDPPTPRPTPPCKREREASPSRWTRTAGEAATTTRSIQRTRECGSFYRADPVSRSARSRSTTCASAASRDTSRRPSAASRRPRSRSTRPILSMRRRLRRGRRAGPTN